MFQNIQKPAVQPYKKELDITSTAATSGADQLWKLLWKSGFGPTGINNFDNSKPLPVCRIYSNRLAFNYLRVYSLRPAALLIHTLFLSVNP